jgi:hypothetical protein
MVFDVEVESGLGIIAVSITTSITGVSVVLVTIPIVRFPFSNIDCDDVIYIW